MKFTKLSLAALAAISLSSSAFAASDLASAFKEGKASGQIRAMYISDDFKSSATQDLSSVAIGGKLKFETAAVNGISAGVSFFTTQAITGDDSKGVANMFDGTGTTTGKGYSTLGEAYLVGTLGKTTVKVGRQQIDSPLAGSDDVRMIPNLFNAALVINTNVPDTTLIGGYVSQMSGVDSAANRSSFTSMSVAALGSSPAPAAGNQGVYVAAVVNNSIKDLTAQAWYYGATEVLNAYYLQADYKLGNLALSGQFYNIDDTGKTAAALGASGANYSVYGAKAAYTVESIGLTPYVAYNKFSKKSSATFVNGAWGGYPEFAAMEEWTTNSSGGSMSDAKLLKVGADYSLEKLGLGNRTLSVAYGKYDYAAANTDTNVYDVAINCDSTVLKNLATKIAYEKVDAGSALTGTHASQTFFKVIMNYSF